MKRLTKETWGDITHYRDDPWWHNAYKIRLNKAYPSESYELEVTRKIQMKTDGNIRLRIWQKNGDAGMDIASIYHSKEERMRAL